MNTKIQPLTEAEQCFDEIIHQQSSIYVGWQAVTALCWNLRGV